MKFVRLLKFDLTVIDNDGLPLDEIIDWIYRGMQDFCEFDYAEIEDKTPHGVEDHFFLELRIILESQIGNAETFNSVNKALKEYCDFDDVTVEITEAHDGLWVNDNYEIAESN